MSDLFCRTLRLFQSVRPRGLALGLVVGLTVVSVATAQSDLAREPAPDQMVASASQAEEDEVMLPSRVAASIERTQNALDRAEAGIDDVQYASALPSLKAVGADIRRAHRAGLRQMNAAPADEEAETTPGPDSVVAVLTLEQTAVTRLAGLFDRVTNAQVVRRLRGALFAALRNRDRMLNAVIALDPEGAGADYADGMADTVDGYTDEVANLTEALQVDRLSPAGRIALNRALGRTKATEAKVNAAFGGGE
jgi:hypothetical protein